MLIYRQFYNYDFSRPKLEKEGRTKRRIETVKI
jgi:hypothetical protein